MKKVSSIHKMEKPKYVKWEEGPSRCLLIKVTLNYVSEVKKSQKGTLQSGVDITICMLEIKGWRLTDKFEQWISGYSSGVEPGPFTESMSCFKVI